MNSNTTRQVLRLLCNKGNGMSRLYSQTNGSKLLSNRIVHRERDMFLRPNKCVLQHPYSTHLDSHKRFYCSGHVRSGNGNALIDKPKVGEMEPKMQIAYTCKVCNTRNHQTFSRNSYQKGVVIVTCRGCNSKHLIADNLGWFKDIGHRNIEEILAEKGESISKITSKDGRIEVQTKDDD